MKKVTFGRLLPMSRIDNERVYTDSWQKTVNLDKFLDNLYWDLDNIGYYLESENMKRLIRLGNEEFVNKLIENAVE